MLSNVVTINANGTTGAIVVGHMRVNLKTEHGNPSSQVRQEWPLLKFASRRAVTNDMDPNVTLMQLSNKRKPTRRPVHHSRLRAETGLQKFCISFKNDEMIWALQMR